MGFSQKRQRCEEYIEALHEERRKILVFQRELPLCLELVTRAIEACKRDTTMENLNGQSECSEQTTDEYGGPVLEEFIPIKPSNEEERDNDEHKSYKFNENKNTKSDWLKSVQLWNQPEEILQEKETVVEVKRNDEMFQSFHQLNADGNRKTPATVASTASGRGGRKKEVEKHGGGQRKQRRSWSQDLHRRFLNALQQLGGAHVATPKQIRDLMRVEGLTNDEVKSHLQKYRLHTRRPSQPVPNSRNRQTPHFVVVGGIWVPHTDKPAVSTSETAGIYGAMAAPTLPPPWPSRSSKFGALISQDKPRCSSPAMSSSAP